MEKLIRFFLLLILLYFCANYLNAQPSRAKLNAEKYSQAINHHAKFNINNISTVIFSNGISDTYKSNSAFEYPKFSGKTVFYASGLIWAAKVGYEFKAGGTNFGTSLKPGRILENGFAENSESTQARIFRVKNNYDYTNVEMEEFDEGKTRSEIIEQYVKDRYEWPADRGAPFEDLNNNLSYEPEIDVPGVPGSDQTLWVVMNDLGLTNPKNHFVSTSMGMEVQLTVWGYNKDVLLANTVFKEYRLINKSKNEFNEMYVGVFVDPDLGDVTNDLAGCDTTMNLGYVYNAEQSDLIYGDKLPAVGACLLQGPIVNGNDNDSVYFVDRWVYQKKSLNMTSFYCYPNIVSPNADPAPWEPIDYHNILRGLKPKGGQPIINPITGMPAVFALPGDPVNQTGWIDKLGTDISNRKFYIASGPFNMATGDTQEISFIQTSSNLGEINDGIIQLKKNVNRIFNSYPTYLSSYKKHEQVKPEYFYISDNYPNPFNAATNFIFELPVDEFVKLEIYNILGEKIGVLVNEFRKAGSYKVSFEGSKLSSGVYIFSFSAGPYFKNKKMILLK